MKNVIISRNGPNSLHQEWLINSDSKSWDLILLYYDEDSFRRTQSQEGKSYFYPGGKWEAYYNFFRDYPEVLNDYDFFWFADDDISIQGKAINKMFQSMNDYDLDIAQPAMSLDSYFSYLVTIQCEFLKIRFSNFVEVMAPCLRKSVVKDMLPFFKDAFTGMGLDSIWTHKTRKEPNKIAILDEVVMTHTRPVGGPLHQKLKEKNITFEEEISSNINKIGIKQIKPVIFSAIDHENNFLDKVQVTNLMVKEYFYKRKDFKDNRKILSRIWRMIKYHRIYRIKPNF